MLNTSRIEELREEVGADGLAEVLDLFCEEVEEALVTLPDTPPADLPDRLHFLKGCAFNIGMEQVGDLCRAAEQRLRSAPNADPGIARIRDAYLASRKALSALL